MLSDHAKEMINKAGNWTVTEITDSYLENIIEKYSLNKNEARKVLARALASNLVNTEISGQVQYIITGETE